MYKSFLFQNCLLFMEIQKKNVYIRRKTFKNKIFNLVHCSSALLAIVDDNQNYHIPNYNLGIKFFALIIFARFLNTCTSKSTLCPMR